MVLQTVIRSCIIDILGYRDEDRLYIQVSDDGCGMSEEQLEMLRHDIDSPSSNSIGLRNVCSGSA